MGCCFSSSQKRHPRSPPCSAVDGRDPPPLEEETVKEVLSETPIPKPSPPKVNEADFPQVKIESTAVVKPREEMRFESTAVVKTREEGKMESTAAIKPEELSEMCSFTESYSTTATEKREEDGEVTQRSPIRVHQRRQNSRVRERSVRSTAGRSAPSPEKRRGGVQGRGMPQHRRPTNGSRRVPASDSALVRRSNSPATRGTVEASRNVRNRSPAASEVEKAKEEVSTVTTGESLENPLVSMECFIFL
ncbi:unnamed protein product [Withania somnifera]